MLAAFYLTKPPPFVPLVWSTDNVFQFVWRMLGSAIVPSLVGGPWRYNGYLSPEWPVFTPFGVIVAVELPVALILVPLAKRRSAWLWLVCLGIVVAELAVIAYGRSSEGVSSVVMRYGGAALVPLVIAAAYCVAVTPVERDGWRARATPARSRVASYPDRRQGSRGRRAHAGVRGLCGDLDPGAGPRESRQRRPAVRGERDSDVRRHPSGAAVVPQFVPGFVIGGARAPAPPTTQVVFGGIPGSPRFANSVAGTSTDSPTRGSW